MASDNKHVFQALERSTFNSTAQQGVTNNTHVYASFATCFTQFSHFIYSYATGIRNYCRQRAFGYFADFSNDRLFVFEDLKPLALLLDVCQRKSLELTSLLQTERAS